MYKAKCATVLKGKKLRNDAQGKCAKILKAKCAKVLMEKCAEMRVRKGCAATIAHRPQGKDKLTMCFECE
jgi:hypothetical protein